MTKPQPHTVVPAAVYDEQRSGWHEDRRLELILPSLPAQPGALVVELGCGAGGLLARLAGHAPDNQYIGVDIDEPLIVHAQQHHTRPGVTFEVGDVTAAWAHRPAQLVISIDVLHHVPDTKSLYGALFRHMAPGALWIAFEPNIWNPAIAFSQERMKRAGLGEDHFRPWTELDRLRHAGFLVEDRRYMLAARQAAQPPQRMDRPLRWIERLPFAGGSVAMSLRRP